MQTLHKIYIEDENGNGKYFNITASHTRTASDKGSNMQKIDQLHKYPAPWTVAETENGRHQVIAQNGDFLASAMGTPLGLRNSEVIEALEFLCAKANKTEPIKCLATPAPWRVEISGEDVQTIKIVAANGKKVFSSIAKAETVEQKIRPHYDFIIAIANT